MEPPQNPGGISREIPQRGAAHSAGWKQGAADIAAIVGPVTTLAGRLEVSGARWASRRPSPPCRHARLNTAPSSSLNHPPDKLLRASSSKRAKGSRDAERRLRSRNRHGPELLQACDPTRRAGGRPCDRPRWLRLRALVEPIALADTLRVRPARRRTQS